MISLVLSDTKFWYFALKVLNSFKIISWSRISQDKLDYAAATNSSKISGAWNKCFFLLILHVHCRSTKSLGNPKCSGLCSWQRENSVNDALALTDFWLSILHKGSGQCTVFPGLRAEESQLSWVVTNDYLKLKWTDSCFQKNKQPKKIAWISVLGWGPVPAMDPL